MDTQMIQRTSRGTRSTLPPTEVIVVAQSPQRGDQIARILISDCAVRIIGPDDLAATKPPKHSVVDLDLASSMCIPSLRSWLSARQPTFSIAQIVID